MTRPFAALSRFDRSSDFLLGRPSRLDLAPFKLSDGTLRQTTRFGNCEVVYTSKDGQHWCCGCALRQGSVIVAASPHTDDTPRHCARCSHTMAPAQRSDWSL